MVSIDSAFARIDSTPMENRPPSWATLVTVFTLHLKINPFNILLCIVVA